MRYIITVRSSFKKYIEIVNSKMIIAKTGFNTAVSNTLATSHMWLVKVFYNLKIIIFQIETLENMFNFTSKQNF